MIIMALDHTRDFFHSTAWSRDIMDLTTTTPSLFLTRWITHFCAPIFVFLSGISIYLQGFRKTKKELSVFLLKRGLWLILLEITLINFSFSFDPHFTTITLQVIWVIGISMVILSAFIYLPWKIILIIGFAIVLGHNLLDNVEQRPGVDLPFIWDLLHRQSFHKISTNHFIGILYPFLPWTGLMMLGYSCGRLFSKNVNAAYRRNTLAILGLSVITFFIVLRWTNIYGDPFKWSQQRNLMFSIFAFIRTQKYPPSLLFMCMTIGPALLFLSLFESARNRLTRIITVYGRVPFFYYLIHFYVIHTVCMLLFLSRGHKLAEGLNAPKGFPVNFIIPGEGYSLTTVYLIWLALVIALYPLCKWYSNYKATHKAWWLSYL
jgi:uncharacterized membrane protein